MSDQSENQLKDNNAQTNNAPANSHAIARYQKRLKNSWLAWLVYRGIILPVLLSLLLTTQPDVMGGIVWQILWLIPALILTPWIIKGKSAYALLMSSMVTLIYLGASGVVVFSRVFDNGYGVVWVYIIDLVLLFLINIWLFILLKKLPSMNNASTSNKSS